jgi:hypothetical protein
MAVEMLDHRTELIVVCTRCREFASGIRTPSALLTSTIFEKTRQRPATLMLRLCGAAKGELTEQPTAATGSQALATTEIMEPSRGVDKGP